MTETNRIEFKERLTRDLDIEKEVVAFLNYREGGILYIGIDKEGRVVGVSNPRNKELMRVFRDVDMVEALGSGMLRVLKCYNRSNFIFMDHFIRVVIPYDWIENDKKDDKKELTKRQQVIYQFIRNSSSYSSTSEPLSEPLNTTYISQHLNIALATLKRDLQVLVEKQFIHRVGGRKNGHWEVIEN